MGKSFAKQDLSSTQIDRHIGERIRRRRTLLGLTQEQLADALGISYQQVQKYETGANRVTAGRLFQIGQSLQCDVAFFYQDLAETPADPAQATQGGVDVSSRAVIELVRNFQAIESEALRSSLLNLARNIASEQRGETRSLDLDDAGEVAISRGHGGPNGSHGVEEHSANGAN